MSSHFRTISTADREKEQEEEQVPRRPPGLLPLAGERLWQPHEDGYWKSLREQWGSTLDFHEEEEEEEAAAVAVAVAEGEEEDVESASRRDRPVAQSQENNNVHIDNNDDDRDAAMFTEQGAIFHIVLPTTSKTGPTPVNYGHDDQYPKRLILGNHRTATNTPLNERTTRGGSFGTDTRYENNINGHEGRRTLIQTSDFTINQPSELPMPPPYVSFTSLPTHTQTHVHPPSPLPRPAVAATAAATKSKAKRNGGGFKGATLNVSVTTTTKTYGDFSRMNPPPYTPKPTGTERSFGRNGKMGSIDDKKLKEKKPKWPVAKWLFILGFLFPVLWLFGSFLLLTGLRKLSAEHQEESQTHAATTTSSPSTKFDTHHHDHYTTDAESQHGNVAHLIAQEVRWSKRCAWAIVIFSCLCFLALGILKAVGI
ncbi:hypothetical protein FRC16_006396 [Serendipita sp. 398]|nr:hypothetical protein FRC16_006396 [Serendipita sp. 398]